MRRLLARLVSVFRRSSQDDDFAQELESHIEMLTADNIASGMSPDEARRAARVKVGAASSLVMQHRDERGLPIVEDLLQDIKFAGRLMARDKWFSAAAVIAIALGIGANTVGFAIINAAFFNNFGFERSEELHAISWRPERGRRATSSPADLEDWRLNAQSFSAIAGYAFEAVNISDDHAPPLQTQGAFVTANLFEMLQQPPLLGRGFVGTDDRRGAEPVVLISHQLWTTRFANDPDVIGRTLRVNGSPSTIVGVMPERMKFPENSELWVPFIPTDAQLARDARRLNVVGRLRPGVSTRQAEAEIEGIARRIIAQHPEQTRGLVGGRVETLIERFVGGQARPMFITVMGAVTFVLLIACANVANLLLSRAMYRGREVAVRYSLGATRPRIIRQLLIESLALAAIGGIIGLPLASFGVDAFAAVVEMSQPPYWVRFSIDTRVLIYVAATCVAAAVLFGLVPAMHLSSAGQHETMNDGGRGNVGSRRGNRFGNALVIAELALTIILLCGAGLMARSFLALYTLDPGFQVDGLMRMRMQLPPARYPTPETREQFFDRLQLSVAALPGITASAFATSVPPLTDEEWRFEIDGAAPVEPERRPFVETVSITPGYFDVLGVPMARGRDLTAGDGAAGAENVVISQRMAERYFTGDDPVGRRIRFTPRSSDEPAQPWRTIVGVSAPFTQGSMDEAFRSAVVFLPLRQQRPRAASLIVRSALPPNDVMAAVRSAVQAIDNDQPVFTIETLDSAIRFERLFHSLFGSVFGILAAIGVMLSAIGIYSVMAYAVTQRTQEIGVRMAVGAQRHHVSWLFLKRCLAQLAIALAIGLPGAIALGQLVSFSLVEITPGDPITIAGISIAVIAIALASCVIPVRRAARVDPVIALRAE
jgi:putative ABC transport system permease protein